MFAEYAKEISDPKNKAESDAYLRQLVNKVGRVRERGPAGDSRRGLVETDETTGRKVFVNVSTATSARTPRVQGCGGMQWQVPHTLGGCHEETDKSGATCDAYDFVSTHTFELPNGTSASRAWSWRPPSRL